MTFLEPPRQIFFVHPAVWEAMELWAKQRNFDLKRIPDVVDPETGAMSYDPNPEVETYCFTPKEV